MTPTDTTPAPSLSTGDPSTLASYMKLSTLVFGEDSAAVKYLNDKIAKQGRDKIVIQDERQMLFLLASLHSNGAQPRDKQ